MTDKKVNVAVVGATGEVGQAMLSILEQRDFPVAGLHVVASSRSAGKTIEFRDEELVVEDLDSFDFSGIDIGLFSPGASVSNIHAPRAAAAGTVVIDNTSRFRYDADIPLVVPEVNPEAVGQYAGRGIIANPNCSTIQMVMALKPVYDAAGIERVNVATYQAVSGKGKKAIEELEQQTIALFNGRPVIPTEHPRQMAFNVLPQIDAFQDNGYTREEMKMVWETRKILGDEALRVNPTCVRVPVFYGHSEAVHIETKEKITVEEVRTLLNDFPGVVVIDEREDGGYPTAVTEASGHDPVFVGRIREDLSHPRGINFWVVSDNIRKGAALNSIQIAEYLLKHHL
ncbi:MAG: aspartate-semialdehyde dehydrogenase [Gammaproteobacteria bacterium]|nr:aspartate-semialdehyde dehydrogenase [Gammaproteobacteria bacterium]MDE0511959.1 aspartate-semialdehyde dehydrogenase [Gammaproteobacteria bacterium]